MRKTAALEIVWRKHEKRNERVPEDRRLEQLKMKLKVLRKKDLARTKASGESTLLSVRPTSLLFLI